MIQNAVLCDSSLWYKCIFWYLNFKLKLKFEYALYIKNGIEIKSWCATKGKKKKKIHTRNIMNKGKKKIRTRKIIKKKNRLSFKNQDIISYITRIVDEFISWNI